MNQALFFENFELLADSPNGVQKLRELILQLAVMGKLVPQDPNDEPASVLLEKIKARKKGKGTKDEIEDKSKTSQTVENRQLSLPLSWVLVSLGDLIYSILGGGTPSKRNPEYWGGEIQWASVKDLGKGKYLEYTIDKITEVGLSQSSTNLIPKGRIIVCTRMGLGKIVINKIDVAINQDLKALHLVEEIDLNYFYNFYLTQNITGSGMTVKGIRQEELLNILVPLPPLAEQKRIVSKVDELMVLCDKLEARRQKKQELQSKLNSAALEKILSAENQEEFEKHWQHIYDNFDLLYDNHENVEKLKKAILQLAIQGKLVPQNPEDEPASILIEKIQKEREKLAQGKKIKKEKTFQITDEEKLPFKCPKGWIWEKINNVCFVTKLAGFEFTKYIQLSDIGEIPTIRAQNVKMNGVNKNNLKYIDLKTSLILERSALTKPSILMTFIGAGIGDIAIFEDSKRWHLGPNVAKLEPFNNFSEKIEIKFLLLYLMSESGRNEIFRNRKSTAQPSLSMETIRDIKVALPPLNEQKSIVEKVEKLKNLCDELEAKLKKERENCGKFMESVVKDLLESATAGNLELDGCVPMQAAAVQLK